MCAASAEAAPEPFAFRSPNTGAEGTDALVPNHLIIRQIEALIDAGGIITAEEAAEWRTRRETALLRQRERQQRPTSAPTELLRRVRDREAGEPEGEKAGSSLMHAAAAAGRSLRRSASLSRRTVALPFQAVSASATRFSQWSAQRSLELRSVGGIRPTRRPRGERSRSTSGAPSARCTSTRMAAATTLPAARAAMNSAGIVGSRGAAALAAIRGAHRAADDGRESGLGFGGFA